MTVNASDPAAAVENAKQGGNAAAEGAVAQEGGHQAHTGTGGTATAGYPAGYGPSGQVGVGTGYTAPAANGSGADQYGAAIQKALDALAAGNREAFARAVHEFDVTFGLEKDKFAEDTRRFNQTFGLTQAQVTGTYQGNPTLAAQQQYFSQGLQGVTLAAGLQANPFRQQQVLGQLGGLYGGQGVAGFQVPNIVQGVGTVGGNTRGGLGYMQQMIDDIRDPTPNQTSMNDILNATPTPTKLNSTEFLRAAPSTQSMVLQAMQEKYGLDPNDSMAQIKNTLPQFQAPSTLGGIRR